MPRVASIRLGHLTQLPPPHFPQELLSFPPRLTIVTEAVQHDIVPIAIE